MFNRKLSYKKIAKKKNFNMLNSLDDLWKQNAITAIKTNDTARLIKSLNERKKIEDAKKYMWTKKKH